MFLDDCIAKLARPMTALDSSCTPEELERLKKELEACLTDQCPRFDIQNIYTVLNPTFIEPAADASEAAKQRAKDRNQALTQKLEDFRGMVEDAQMIFPYPFFWVEYRINQHQRISALIRAVNNVGEVVTKYEQWDRLYKATTAIENKANVGQIEYTPDAFSIYLDPTTDLYASTEFNPFVLAKDCRKEIHSDLAESVRAAIAFRNWNDADVPCVTVPASGKHKGNGNGGRHKSDPTIIKFEPFLGKHRTTARITGSGSGQPMPWHRRRGGYINFSWAHPMFGRPPKLGSTVGRFKRPPTIVNNGRGKFRTTKGTIVIGDVHNPNKKRDDKGGKQ